MWSPTHNVCRTFGQVFLARNEKSSQEVAIKRVKYETAPELQTCLRELELLEIAASCRFCVQYFQAYKREIVNEVQCFC